MGSFDPKRFTLSNRVTAPKKPQDPQKPPRHKQGEKFLKGPVPLTWLSNAGQLPGKSLHVGVVLWFLAGLKKTRSVALPNSVLRLFGVDRYAKYRALGWMEKTGLIAVEQNAGCNPIITLLDKG